MVRRHLKGAGRAALAALVAVASVSFTATGAHAASPPWTERIIPLKPSITFVRASFLTGEIVGLKVVEHVQPGTEILVGSPMLEATLTLSNDSRDQSARLLGGKIEYIDAAGKLIPTAGNSFVFTITTSDRLDPGQSLSQPIAIAFPPAALKLDALRDVNLELTYLPIPYHTDTVDVPVYLGG